MASTRAYEAVQRVEPLLISCVEASELLKQIDRPDESTFSTIQLNEPLNGVENGLVCILVELLNRKHRCRHPFRGTTLEEACFRATLRGCSDLMSVLLYNLKLLVNGKSPVTATWNGSQKLLEDYNVSLQKLLDSLRAVIIDQSLSSFLEKVNAHNKGMAKLRELVENARKENDRPVVTEQSREQSLPSEASTMSNTPRTPSTSRQSTLVDDVYDTLKKLDLFDREPPKGKRRTWLFKAIEEGCVKAVELLINLGVDVNQRSSNADSKDQVYLPLCYAARKGETAIVELLLKNGADIHARDNLGNNAVLSATYHGQNNVINLLLNAPYNADVEVQRTSTDKRRNFTPLMTAVYREHLDTIKLLFGRGAKRDIISEAGDPLLHIVTDVYPVTHIYISERLILPELGKIACLFRGIRFPTPLAFWVLTHIHIATGNKGLEVTKFLLGNGAQVVATNKLTGDTTLHLAVRNNSLEVAGFLIDKDAPLDADNKEKQTPLTLAAKLKKPEMVRMLLDKGAKSDSIDSHGRTPLHNAILAKDSEMVNLLVERGTKVESRDNDGQTPLHYAVMGEDSTIVAILLSGGYKMGIKNSSGSYPLQYVMEMPTTEQSQAVLLLQEFLKVHVQGDNFHPGYHALPRAARDGKLELVKEMLSFDPQLVNQKPIAASCYSTNRHCMKLSKLIKQKLSKSCAAQEALCRPWT